VIEVLFEDGVWYLGRLMERARGWNDEGPPRWWVEFDDGGVNNDIWLNDPKARVRFEPYQPNGNSHIAFQPNKNSGASQPNQKLLKSLSRPFQPNQKLLQVRQRCVRSGGADSFCGRRVVP